MNLKVKPLTPRGNIIRSVHIDVRLRFLRNGMGRKYFCASVQSNPPLIFGLTDKKSDTRKAG